MCAGYKVGRFVLQDGEKHSLSLFLIEHYYAICKLCYESSSGFM